MRLIDKIATKGVLQGVGKAVVMNGKDVLPGSLIQRYKETPEIAMVSANSSDPENRDEAIPISMPSNSKKKRCVRFDEWYKENKHKYDISDFYDYQAKRAQMRKDFNKLSASEKLKYCPGYGNNKIRSRKQIPKGLAQYRKHIRSTAKGDALLVKHKGNKAAVRKEIDEMYSKQKPKKATGTIHKMLNEYKALLLSTKRNNTAAGRKLMRDQICKISRKK